ncbi:helix-turn-helix domain-containing protein [Arthrobacter sp. ISL-69]|uniref:helix-turn-helix domain-containing protein n=1 Tax=Arthrobacter sp. ISL-69 TaxID=2819113 RepID=UPI001BECD9CD|nr:helix-turn-helix transcriptional regulator [Arthrobacter sp. ISL-69]MBT2538871.1 helix-turn-helix transcriptional regulator [Arthrobacter sp. ISL-69]
MNDAKALKVIGALVREHRLRLGHSQQDFAARIGVRAPTIRFFEKGYRWPGDEVRNKIEAGLGWRPGSIMKFRDHAHSAPGLDSAWNTLRSIVAPSSSGTDSNPSDGQAVTPECSS